MFYSDKETEESEKKFQENLERVRKFAVENQEQQGAVLYALLEEGNRLKELENPTPEEVARLKAVIDKIEELAKVFNENLQVLEESLARSSNYIYHEIKKKAEEGDPAAMKVYLELKPEYEEIILSRTSAN